MTLQSAVEFDEYFRCYVVGQEQVRVMKYDPKQPHHLRYVKDSQQGSEALHQRVVDDCLKLCRALGYDFNTVEFAVQNGVPYAIDFLNPAPDADVHSVGQANFDWVVENVAQLAITKGPKRRAAAGASFTGAHFLQRRAAGSRRLGRSSSSVRDARRYRR